MRNCWAAFCALNYTAHSARTHAWADKGSSLLAWLVRQETPRQPILSLRATTGTLLHTQREIHTELAQHYTSVYSSCVMASTSELAGFLAEVTFPKATPEQVEDLNAPLSLTEIKSASSSLATGKTPGPDGFPSEFYKAYADQLAPALSLCIQRLWS